MKTCVIITGAMRSFAKTLPNQAWMVFRHLNNPDFFVSIYKDGTEGQAELLRAKYPNSRVEIEVIAEQPDCVAEMRALGVTLPTTWTRGQPYTCEPHAITVNPQAVLRQLWQLQKGWELMERVGNARVAKEDPHGARQATNRGWDYDRVVRLRPDLWFQGQIKPAEMQPDLCFAPWWGRFGGINDRFAVMGSAAAEAYFHTYQNVPRLMAAGCPLHPESLILASLEGCTVNHTLPVEFATLRANGEMRQPEISAADIAHFAAHR